MLEVYAEDAQENTFIVLKLRVNPAPIHLDVFSIGFREDGSFFDIHSISPRSFTAHNVIVRTIVEPIGFEVFLDDPSNPV